MNSQKADGELCVTVAVGDIQGFAKDIWSEEVKEEKTKIESKKEQSPVI